MLLFTPTNAETTKVKAPPVVGARVSPATIFGPKLSTLDVNTKSGLVHLYDLEYDRAISDFEKTFQEHPEDPFALNHLLQAVLLKELYRLNALDTTLYADNGFLTGRPLPSDPAAKARIQELSELGIQIAEKRLKSNPNDVDALYARGVTRGLRLSYVAIIEKSFFAALKNASASRSDHERVIELDPHYTDAKLVIGVHNFVLGSMPLAAKILAGMVGMSGNKKKGIDCLYEVGNSHGETSTDARVALGLFLRREARYLDALAVTRTLTAEHPRNFIFGLEEANLLKDAGMGAESIAAYSLLLKNAKAGIYFEPHLERAAFGLAEALKGQRKAEEAVAAYNTTLKYPALQPDVKIRALLGAGEMLDALNQRDQAEQSYRSVIGLDGDSPQAAAARRFLKQPFRYSN